MSCRQNVVTRRVVEGFARKNLVTQHRVSYIPPQLLTFKLRINIPLQVVLFSSFRVDEKKQKTRHTGKEQSNFSLLRNCFAISFGLKGC